MSRRSRSMDPTQSFDDVEQTARIMSKSYLGSFGYAPSTDTRTRKAEGLLPPTKQTRMLRTERRSVLAAAPDSLYVR